MAYKRRCAAARERDGAGSEERGAAHHGPVSYTHLDVYKRQDEEYNELYSLAQQLQWRNKAISDTYEPGSTFKIITLAMALEEGVVSENSSFYCGGSMNVLGRGSPLKCWKYGGHGSQSLTQAVQHSCNVAFVNIGQLVGEEKMCIRDRHR